MLGLLLAAALAPAPLVTDLADTDFKTRQRAYRALRTSGAPAVPALALGALSRDLERRRACERLLRPYGRKLERAVYAYYAAQLFWGFPDEGALAFYGTLTLDERLGVLMLAREWGLIPSDGLREYEIQATDTLPAWANVARYEASVRVRKYERGE